MGPAPEHTEFGVLFDFGPSPGDLLEDGQGLGIEPVGEEKPDQVEPRRLALVPLGLADGGQEFVLTAPEGVDVF